jgi:hypothetical protein
MSRKYLVGPVGQIADIRSALNIAEGLPRRAVVVGGPDMLPTTYTPGAPGWTDQVCPPPIDGGDGTQAVLIPDEADRHLGKTVRVGQKNVVLPEPSSKVSESTLPPKFRAHLASES